jgi:gas vesicle protein
MTTKVVERLVHADDLAQYITDGWKDTGERVKRLIKITKQVKEDVKQEVQKVKADVKAEVKKVKTELKGGTTDEEKKS